MTTYLIQRLARNQNRGSSCEKLNNFTDSEFGIMKNGDVKSVIDQVTSSEQGTS
jgi:hypothetical protein